MNCENVMELLSASLDGELNSAQEAQLQAHLDQCPNCRALRDELLGIHGAFSEMEALPPAEPKERIMANLPPQRPGKVICWKRWGAMAAALALVALAAWRLPHSLYQKSATNDATTAETTESVQEDMSEVAVAGGYDDTLSISESADDPMLSMGLIGYGVLQNSDPLAEISMPDTGLGVVENGNAAAEALPASSAVVEFTGYGNQSAAKRSAVPVDDKRDELLKQSTDASPDSDMSDPPMALRALSLDPVYAIDDSDTDVIPDVLPTYDAPIEGADLAVEAPATISPKK